MDKKKMLVWILQIICAGILFPIGWGKISSGQGEIQLFAQLGMKPYGRFIIGWIKLTCAVCFLINRLAATGSFTMLGVMFGAIIAHTTVIEFSLMGYGGKHILLLITVLGSSLVITFIRRKEIPLIGNSLE